MGAQHIPCLDACIPKVLPKDPQCVEALHTKSPELAVRRDSVTGTAAAAAAATAASVVHAHFHPIPCFPSAGSLTTSCHGLTNETCPLPQPPPRLLPACRSAHLLPAPRLWAARRRYLRCPPGLPTAAATCPDPMGRPPPLPALPRPHEPHGAAACLGILCRWLLLAAVVLSASAIILGGRSAAARSASARVGLAAVIGSLVGLYIALEVVPHQAVLQVGVALCAWT